MSATENPTALVVIFLLIALAIGLFCRNILSRVVPIPYTVRQVVDIDDDRDMRGFPTQLHCVGG